MATLCMSIVCNFLMCILLEHVYGSSADMENHHCTPEVLKTVNMTHLCGRTLYIPAETSVAMVPENHPYTHIMPSCLNCTVIIKSPRDAQLLATLYKLGTETRRDDGTCDMNRLDVYDGDVVDSNNRISGDGGICGCTFPARSEFRSTNNTLTLHLATTCHVQHGDLELIISSVRNDAYNTTKCNGEFECENGQCIDKNLVCNGEKDCKDNSDEINCHVRNGTCPGKFECQDGACVDKNHVCDGEKDCPDGSDEINCHHNVTCAGKFECLNGRCIGKNDVCNGKNDCSDNSDETGCSGISRVLLYVLIGIGAAIIILLVVITILTYKYCWDKFRLASVYRRLS